MAIVDKTTDIPGTIQIKSADGQTSYLPNSSDTDTTATFHLHGNSTIYMPKVPYHVKLNTSLDLLGAMGLVCPYVTSAGKAVCDKSKSYILLANYDDKTLLRDWAASALANAIPMGGSYLNSPAGSPSPSGTAALMPWAPHSLFVELYLNGVYEGNYQLIEEIKVDSHRVNITELAQTDTTLPNITGGYLMEIDDRMDEAFTFTTPQGVPIGLNDPDFTPSPEVPEQTAYISNYVTTAENALYGANYTDPKLGWRAYFDEASAISFYIVNDVMGNVDGGGFASSDYLYKERNNPLIYMGPIWDFDISSGNVNYASIVNPTQPWMQINGGWYVRWLTDPGFKADLTAEWNLLKSNGVFTSWIASIQQQAAKLEQSQANNQGRWPMQGIEVWPNSEAAGSYDGEVSYLTNWITLRIAYLDSILNSKMPAAVTLSAVNGPVYSGSPVTLTAQVTGIANPAGVVTFVSNGTVVGTATLSGITASAVIASLPAGADTLQAVYNGDQNSALALSASQLVNVMPALVSTVTSIGGPDSMRVIGRILRQSSAPSFTVNVVANSGNTIPAGTVTFIVDGSASQTMIVDGDGSGVFTADGISAGSHTLSVRYSGDGIHMASLSSVITFEISPIEAIPTRPGVSRPI